MLLAGRDLIKSVHVSLQRGDPRLIRPYPWHFFSPAFFSLPFPSFFSPYFSLCPCTSAAPSLCSRTKGNKGSFSPPPLSFSLLKYILFFSSVFFHPSCAAPSLCVIDFSFVCQACLSPALSRTLSPTALSPALSLFLDHCPPPLSFFPYVHLFKAVFLGVCVSLSVWQVLNIHMHFCVRGGVSHTAGTSADSPPPHLLHGKDL